MKSRTNGWIIISLCQIEHFKWHPFEEGLSFGFNELLLLLANLENCHWIVLFHEPGLLLVLFPKSAGMIILMLLCIASILKFDCVEVSLPCLQA